MTQARWERAGFWMFYGNSTGTKSTTPQQTIDWSHTFQDCWKCEGNKQRQPCGCWTHSQCTLHTQVYKFNLNNTSHKCATCKCHYVLMNFLMKNRIPQQLSTLRFTCKDSRKLLNNLHVFELIWKLNEIQRRKLPGQPAIFLLLDNNANNIWGEFLKQLKSSLCCCFCLVFSLSLNKHVSCPSVWRVSRAISCTKMVL